MTGDLPALSAIPRLPAELQDKESLPAFKTEQEKAELRNWSSLYALQTSQPPTGTVRVPAEFAAMAGAVVHIPMDGALQDFFGTMVHEIVDAGGVPYLLVGSTGEANNVKKYFLTPYGTSTTAVQFVTAANDAFWSRDFGPFYIYVGGKRAIVDMEYYPTRPDDNEVPLRLGEFFNEDVYGAPLFTEGGNFMTDGLGTCWASTGIFNDNNLTEAQAKSLYKSYLGCTTMKFIQPLPGEGTTHIDMFSKILDQDTILVAYSQSSWGATTAQRNQLDAAAQAYANTPKPGGGSFKIVRIPMRIDNNDGVFYAYTNSLIMNGTAIVPTYNDALDAQALQVYQDAMPNGRVVGVPSANVIPLGGSVHCTTMQVPVVNDPFGGNTAKCDGQKVEPGEVCDGNTVACTSLPGGYTGGTATCNATCTGWNTSACTAPNNTEATIQRSGTVAKGKYTVIDNAYFQAADGRFIVNMTGTGDADLYVWKNVTSPTWSNYTCRPYLDGSAESCSLSGPGTFMVAVSGYATSSNYNLSITYTPR